jgi:outer membrane receptor for ferrienterochelin and colicin
MVRNNRLLFLMVLGAAPSLFSQGSQSGNITGTVRGANGAAISGARVVLKTERGERATTSGPDGSYRFSQLIPSVVTISVSANGFVSASSDIRINVDRTNVLDFPLKPIATQEATVVVTAKGEAVVNTRDALLGQNLSKDELSKLPLNNRDIAAYVNLAPGISNDGNGQTIRGGQSTQVQYLVDGADVIDPVTGGPSVFLNEEFLDEVQVQTGAISAEYGRFTGGVVNAVTVTGTNEFKGTVRFQLSSPKWNAFIPKEDRVSTSPKQQNHISTIQNYVFRGPIIKDHLFFAVGYRTFSPLVNTPGTTSSIAFGNVPFASTSSQDRSDIKLDWQISTNHRVSVQYNRTKNIRTNIDYPTAFGLQSTSVDTLSSQTDKFSYTTFGYSGTLSEKALLDVRYSKKDERLGGADGPSGGQGKKNAPLWLDQNSGDIFDNGFFANDGDSRPVQNATANLTLFFDAAGSHEFKTGLQWFNSKRNSANAQTPSNYIIYFEGFTGPGPGVGDRFLDPTSGLSYLEFWEPIFGAVTRNDIYSLYANDKWKLNTNWSVTLGLRYDNFKSKDDLGRDNFSMKEWSPRLAVVYDPVGDGRSAWSASYGVYVGQVLQGSTDSASPAGNPVQRDYIYLSGPALLPDGSVNRSAFASTPFFENDPFTQRNTKFDPNVKAPRMREYSLAYRHASEKWGSWSASWNYRNYDRFVDDFSRVDPDGVFRTELKNDDNLERQYQSLEIVHDKKLTSALSYGFNATWSTLRGNFEGGQVGTNDQINNFGVGNISNVNLNRYGYLAADRRLISTANIVYTSKIGRGTLNTSFLHTYQSGAPYSLIGSNTPTTGLPAGYPSSYGRYFSERGALRFFGTQRSDVQVAYDLPLIKGFSFFSRLNVQNVFNHQSQVTFNTFGTTVAGAFKPGVNFGKANSSNYANGRTLNFAAGIKF